MICGRRGAANDVKILKSQGVAAIYGPGTRILDTIPEVLGMINERISGGVESKPEAGTEEIDARHY